MKPNLLKTLSLVAALLLLVCALPVNAVLAADNTTDSGLTYTKNGNDAVITGCNGNPKEVIIPEKIGNLTVTEIAKDAFKNGGFVYISIPKTIEKIGADAFLDCYAIETVDIADIGAWCEIDFKNEYANPAKSVYAKLCIDGAELKSLYVPDGTEKIGAFAFFGNTGIEKVFIPQSVKSIGQMAFKGATKIKDIYCISTGKEWEAITEKAPAYIPDKADVRLINPKETAIDGLMYTEENGKIVITGYEGNLYKLTIPAEIDGKPVSKIDSYAFEGINTLAEVILPDTIREIFPGAFCECKYLAKINIPEGVDFIHEEAFRGCQSLLELSLPSSVREISYYAFNGCQSIAKLKVPEGTEIVADHAFSDCYNLKEISLPLTLTQLAGTAFYDTAYFKNTDNWTDNALYIDGCLIKVNENTEGEFYINAGTKIIGDYAFYDCKSITEIIVPESLISVGNYCFYGCSGLSSINIPHTVQYVGYHAFSECRGLNALNFGGNSLQWSAAVGENNVGVSDSIINFGKENEYILGDATLDGRLNVRDATAIQKHAAKIVIIEGKALELADFNADGKINVRDATAIQKHIAGMHY